VSSSPTTTRPSRWSKRASRADCSGDAAIRLLPPLVVAHLPLDRALTLFSDAVVANRIVVAVAAPPQNPRCFGVPKQRCNCVPNL